MTIFITGTGTDVGKTFVSALLVKNLRETGINCGYYKPALSGADGEGLNDCSYVAKVAGLEKGHSSYIFKTPMSPHIASEIEHDPIELDKIISDYAEISKKYEHLIVEGAGGITCPFNLTQERILLPDVIKALELDIIIVANAALGTINYTLLTAEYAKQQGINVRGIILNRYNENNLLHRDNKRSIEELTGIPVIATVQENATEINIDTEVLK